MYLHEKAEIIFRGKKYKAKTLRKEIERIKQKIEEKVLCKEQTVAIALERGPELLISIFALLEMEIPFLLVDMEQPEERLEDMFRQADIKYIISKQGKVNIGYLVNILYDEMNTEILEYKGGKYGNEIAYVLFTSGSTGKPKAVEVTRVGLKNFIEGIPEIIDFSEGKVILSLSTHTFDIFFLETIMALVKGLHVVLAAEEERKNPKRIEELIIRHQIDIVQMTPSTMQLLYFYERELGYFKNVKEILLGGESFPKRLLENLQALTNAKIYNMYGPTETTIWSSVADLTNEKEVHIGEPIRNTKFFLLNEQMESVNDGEIGEICIGGDGLARGYIGNDELTKKVFVYQKNGTRVYKTGDYGRINSAGKLECLGRKDFQIKILGHRVELEDIDNNLRFFPGMQDCVTCFDGKALIAFYKAEHEFENKTIVDFLRKRVPSYMIPNQYIRVSEFIYNCSGKLVRNEMIKQNMGECKERKNIFCKVENRSNKVVQVLSECLEKTDIALDKKTSIGELNIDSFTYVKMIVELEEIFGIDFDSECLNKSYFTTIGEIEKYINAKKDKREGKYFYGKSCGATSE